MSKTLNKAGTIIKAFSEPLPVGEPWYEERVDICNSCEYNSKNISDEELSTVNRLKKNTINPCPEKDFCTMCGCCTHRKASQKSEECGLSEKGETPKWPALKVNSKLSKDILAENLSPKVGELYTAQDGFIYDIGETSEELLNFTIKLSRKGGLDVKATTVGCGCTVADTKILSEDEAEFGISLSTTNFNKGVATKRVFTVEHYVATNKVEKVKVTMKLKLT